MAKPASAIPIVKQLRYLTSSSEQEAPRFRSVKTLPNTGSNDLSAALAGMVSYDLGFFGIKNTKKLSKEEALTGHALKFFVLLE